MFQILLSVSLANGFILPVEALAKSGGGSCTDKIVAKCKSDGAAAGMTDAVGSDSNMYGNASMGAAEAKGASARMGAAAQECADSAALCNKCPQAERESCKKEVGQAEGDMKAQSASLGGNGDAMGMIAGLLGAALPMLMKDKGEEEAKQDPNAALQCNSAGQCTVDCSKDDAYKYSGCGAQLAQKCKTAMSDTRCIQFANRYCNAEGAGSPFCATATAYAFCSPGGRDQCPSCLQLQKESAPACLDNPALPSCMGQNSPEQTQQMRAACPNDPVFLAGGAGAGQPYQSQLPVQNPVGAGSGASGNPVNPVNPGLQPPILPVQAAGSGATGSGSSASAGSRGISTFSTTPGRGPASDVNGQFGPSVFAVSSQVIRSRCAAGRFLNCP